MPAAARRKDAVPEDPVDRWVRELNAAGRELDEAAASMHPSRWHEDLRGIRDRWSRLARRGPRRARG